MRAIGCDVWGGPEALHVVELPEPQAGAGQVLVRVTAAGVAPVDVMARSGLLAARYEGMEPPFVPGMEIAGTVEAADPDDDRLAVGEAVVAFVDFGGSWGGYSELLALPTASVVRAPAGLSPAEAATSVLNPLTARNALDALALEAGASLLVTGAAGAVGENLVQLSTMEGLRVVAQASAREEERVRSLGASLFVSRDDDLAAATREMLPGGVDAVVDAAGIGLAAAAAVRDGGQFASLRPMPDEPGRGIRRHVLNVRDRATDTAALTRMRGLVEAGWLTVRPVELLGAAEAAEAHRRLQAGGLRSRLALAFPLG